MAGGSEQPGAPAILGLTPPQQAISQVGAPPIALLRVKEVSGLQKRRASLSRVGALFCLAGNQLDGFALARGKFQHFLHLRLQKHPRAQFLG